MQLRLLNRHITSFACSFQRRRNLVKNTQRTRCRRQNEHYARLQLLF
uniref:Uncharacterized protein n=1 Tax=Arundo donax TaxID=35708 RepID=A0A0A8YKY6_ARUDO